ncbi:MAG: hypothetical protein ABFD69_12565 [Candidatus Sumerlaeia bacterium]
MNPNRCSRFWADWVLAFALMAVLVLVYIPFIQINLTWDGAFFIHEELKPVRHGIATHFLFGPWLRSCLLLGARFGIEPRIAGSIQSLVTMVAAMGLFYVAMRRCGIGRPWAAAYTLLMGCNAPALENATTVEVYGVAMLAVMLSLHGFLNEARSPNFRGSAWLLAANILVAWVHVGFCFWVLGLYLALGLSERFVSRFMLRLGQGLLVLLVLMGTKYQAKIVHLDLVFNYRYMYHTFYHFQPCAQHLVNALLAPLDSIQAFAGLSIFPAVVGWRVMRGRLTALSLHAVVTSLLFVGFFHAWNTDFGVFYMPVMILWGIFAAHGCEAAFRSGDRAVQISLLALACFAVACAILPFQDFRFVDNWIHGTPNRLWLGALFYGFLIAQWLVAGRILNREAAPRPVGPALAFTAAGMALAASVFCFLPRPLFYLRADETHEYTMAVRSLMRGRDLGHERLITAFQVERVEFETGVKACASTSLGHDFSDGVLFDQNLASEWIRDGGYGENELHVWIDARALEDGAKYWKLGILNDIPIESLEFEPVAVDCEVKASLRAFYRIRFTDMVEARRYAFRLDPYPPEEAGDTRITRIRPNYEQAMRREGEWLELNYLVEHPEVGPLRPVGVEFFLNGAAAGSRRHVQREAGAVRLRVPESCGPDFALGIRVTPGWRAADGRELGVALLPAQWGGKLAAGLARPSSTPTP